MLQQHHCRNGRLGEDRQGGSCRCPSPATLCALWVPLHPARLHPGAAATWQNLRKLKVCHSQR